MTEVFRSADLAHIGLYQSILEDAGILTFVRNEMTQQALGGLAMAFFPIPLYLPALCVVDDGDYPEAMSLLRSLKNASAEAATDWKCGHCGETVPDTFSTCWHCQRPR